jgi:hypothetical protein
LWGFASSSVIAPCYTWANATEAVLHQHGVGTIQGGRAQISYNQQGEKKLNRHFTGQLNSLNQVYLVRNVHFEPSENQNKSSVGSAWKEIELAFALKKPAILSSHRVNYIGRLDPSNRERSLLQLKQLLEKVVARWPEVVFLSSDQLGQMIKGK